MYKDHILAAILELQKAREIKSNELSVIDTQIASLQAIDTATVASPSPQSIIPKRTHPGRKSYWGNNKTGPVGKALRALMADGKTRTLDQIAEELKIPKGSREYGKLTAAIAWMKKEGYFIWLGDATYRKSKRVHFPKKKEKPVENITLTSAPQSVAELAPPNISISQAILEVLKNTGMAMTSRQVSEKIQPLLEKRWPNMPNHKRVNRVSGMMANLIRRGKAARLGPGLIYYTATKPKPETPTKTEAPNSSQTKTSLIIGTLGRGQELTPQEIFDRIETQLKENDPNFNSKLERKRIGVQLAQLAQQGRLIRVREGVYSFR